MGETLQPGEVIGQYTIESELGRGPLGISYRARTADDEVVALKVMKANPALSDAEKASIARDFHALEDLQSPQVPILLEFVRYGDRYVIATDYLPLGDFSARLAQGPLSLRAALTLIRHLTYAVGRAHEVGVVHGGIKPTNVLRREVNGRQIPVLGDFGGSLRKHRWVPPGAARDDNAYRAPELAIGGDLTPATDVYALGALLGAMTANVATPEVQAVIDRATSSDPARRYPTGHQMFEALSDAELAAAAASAPPVAAAPPEPEPHTGVVVPELAPVELPVPAPLEGSVLAAALTADPEVDRAHERAEERARILNSATVSSAPDRRYHSRARLITSVLVLAAIALVLSLLLTKHNVFNRPHVVATPVLTKTTPAYRAVEFQFQQPVGDATEIQVLKGSTWISVGGLTYRQGTVMGGERGCASFRVADESNSPADYSNTVTSCGVSKKPTLAVTVDPNNCTYNGFTQVCYTFLASGLKPGVTHPLTLKLSGKVIGTIQLTVDPSGHASLPAGQHFHFESTSGGQTAEADYAGLRLTWFVANT